MYLYKNDLCISIKCFYIFLCLSLSSLSQYRRIRPPRVPYPASILGSAHATIVRSHIDDDQDHVDDTYAEHGPLPALESFGHMAPMNDFGHWWMIFALKTLIPISYITICIIYVYLYPNIYVTIHIIYLYLYLCRYISISL